LLTTTGGSGTDIAGGTLYLAGGKGTGAGVGGKTIIQVASASTTGSSLNSLVDVLTVDSATQNVLIQTSAAAIKGLVVKGASAQTANLQEWQNSSGTVKTYVNAAGALHTSDGTANNYIELDASTAHLAYIKMKTTSGGQTTIYSDNSSNIGFLYGNSKAYMNGASNPVQFWIGNSASSWDTIFGSLTGTLTIRALATKTIILRGSTGQTENITEWRDPTATTVYNTVSENGYFTTRKTTAPDDAELSAGEVSFWFDSTDGAAKLKIKGKSADGTVVQGEVALT